MPTKIMVASGQSGYRAALVNDQNQIIQVFQPHRLRLTALAMAQMHARRAGLRFDDSTILPSDKVTHGWNQVGQQRSVKAYCPGSGKLVKTERRF